MNRDWSWAAVRERTIEGAKEGMAFGVGYCVYALLLLVVRGPELFASAGSGVVMVLALYLAGGAIAGTICGGLEPLTGSLVGRILVGIIAALPFAFLLGLTVLPAEDIRPNLVPVALGCAVLWGVMGGTMFWYTRD
jgi:hypothetical protein